MPSRLVLLASLLCGAASLVAQTRTLRVGVVRNAGFAAKTRKPKKTGKKAKSSAAGLTTDAGWVPLTELEAPVVEGDPKAVGRNIKGQPYLVRRQPDGSLVATQTPCGRCEYPLLKAKARGASEIVCDMCGAAYDVTDGSAAEEDKSARNPLVGGLLSAKPQAPLLTFPLRELDDGRVFVNITPK